MRSLPDLLCQSRSAYILEFNLLQEMQHFRPLVRLLDTRKRNENAIASNMKLSLFIALRPVSIGKSDQSGNPRDRVSVHENK
jgi:hypothetical protein